MRATIVIFLCVLAVPLALISPFHGLLAYCWLSYARPQEWAWGISHVNFGFYVAVALFVGLAARFRLRFFRWSAVTVLLLALWGVWCAATLGALDTEAASGGLAQISKIFLICLVTTALAVTKDRLRWVVLAIVGSLSFHAVKMGLFGLLNPGVRMDQGIGGMMSGNNENAIAFGIALPFLVYLGIEEKRALRRLLWFGAAFCATVAIVLSYSRGGFLGIAAAGLVMVWRTRARFVSLFVVAPVVISLFLALAPSEFVERVSGIQEASKTDLSVIRRLEAWDVAWTIAKEHPFLGIGPRNFLGQFHRFPHPFGFPRMEIHNTYLEFLASSGFLSLGLYLALVVAAFRSCSRVQRDALGRNDPRLSWFVSMGRAMQASMAVFLVSSTFGSLMHFDLMYHLCALSACLPVAYRHELDRLGAATADATAAAAESPTERPALSRYERRPVLPSGLPAGLPDFRSAAR